MVRGPPARSRQTKLWTRNQAPEVVVPRSDRRIVRRAGEDPPAPPPRRRRSRRGTVPLAAITRCCAHGKVPRRLLNLGNRAPEVHGDAMMMAAGADGDVMPPWRSRRSPHWRRLTSLDVAEDTGGGRIPVATPMNDAEGPTGYSPREVAERPWRPPGSRFRSGLVAGLAVSIDATRSALRPRCRQPEAVLHEDGNEDYPPARLPPPNRRRGQ